MIAKQVSRSEKSLRGMVYQRLGTENLVKVREALLNGEMLEVKPQNRIRKEGCNEKDL